MFKSAFPLLLAGAGSVSAALQVDFGSPSSVKSAVKDVAFDLMSYYKGNQSGQIPGILGLPPPSGDYYWWTGAVLWSTMIDYWYYTGDDTYNTVALEGMVHQNGPTLDNPFMPPNWTASMANDDYGFWGMSAMSAAELNFPSAPEGEPSWIALAQDVFGVLESRYADETECKGGLRWAVTPVQAGYNYKNTMANAIFLNLGARLARYTGNQTYGEWANKTWDWLTTVGLIDKSFNVFDGGHVASNCTDTNKLQFTANAGVLIEGAAYMYNHTTGTAQATWQTRLEGLTNNTLSHFFSNTTQILTETACEKLSSCNQDMVFFKGILLRALASTAQLAPFLHDKIVTNGLKATAEAAVEACTGGSTGGRECAFAWTAENSGEYKFKIGPPAEMNALSALLGLLVDEAAPKGFATNATASAASGSGGSGSGTGTGSGSGGSGSGSGSTSQGNGDGGSAGTTTRVAVGWILAGLVAALF